MITLNTKRISLTFDEERCILTSLRYKEREYIGGKLPLFALCFLNEAGERIHADAATFSLTQSESCKDGFCCRYTGDEAEVALYLNMEDGLCWQISVMPRADLLTEWVNYPQICVPDDLIGSGGTSRILWGYNEGAVIDDFAVRDRSFPYREPDYPHVSVMGIYPAMVESQCLAYYGKAGGLYLAAHDSEDCLKGIDFYRKAGGILLQFRHFPGKNYGERYTMPYPMVTRFFDGDWQAAAEIYRTWLKEAKADRLLPIAKNHRLPDWYGDSPVVVTYPVRGKHDMDEMTPNKLFPYTNALPYLDDLSQKLNSRLLVLLMHWEGTAPWAPPFVCPPFGGEEAFRVFVDALHERGHLVGVYCSGLGYTEQSNLIKEYNNQERIEREGLKDIFCTAPNGEILHSNICTAQRTGYDMCPACQRTVDIMVEEVAKLRALGVDYIQLMDQNHGGTSHFCYSKHHGHNPAPGPWQVEAMRQLYKAVGADTGAILFGCESATAEAYIPYLPFSDNRFNLSYRYGLPVPLYSYLYHEYINNFMGNQVCAQYAFNHQASPDNILLRLSYAFLAGDMLTLVLKENGEIDWNWGMRECPIAPDGEAVKQFVKEANAWRRGKGKKYLHTGRMIPPYPTRSESRRFVRALSKPFLTDSVPTAAYVAEDGLRGQFFCNYGREPQSVTVTLSEGCHRCHTLTEEYELTSGEVMLTIPPHTVYMIETIS